MSNNADLKAWLAQLGQSVHPEAKARQVTPPPPGSRAPVIVLERVRKDELPEYCVHGYASCINCRELCWLGHNTEKVVSSGEAFAVCVECATKIIPPDSQGPVRHVQDHLRKDGPHE